MKDKKNLKALIRAHRHSLETEIIRYRNHPQVRSVVSLHPDTTSDQEYGALGTIALDSRRNVRFCTDRTATWLTRKGYALNVVLQ